MKIVTSIALAGWLVLAGSAAVADQTNPPHRQANTSPPLKIQKNASTASPALPQAHEGVGHHQGLAGGSVCLKPKVLDPVTHKCATPTASTSTSDDFNTPNQ